MKSVFPGLDVKAMADEIRERIHEELDYELEASEPEDARAHLPRPPVHRHPRRASPSLSREKVVVSEFVDGRGFEELKQLPQDERDRIGEIIFRFYFGCMYRHRQFSGDPHPGNSLLLDDGRMAFLDFGLFKRISEAVADSELRIGRAGIEERRRRAARRARSTRGFLARPVGR